MRLPSFTFIILSVLAVVVWGTVIVTYLQPTPIEQEVKKLVEPISSNETVKMINDSREENVKDMPSYREQGLMLEDVRHLVQDGTVSIDSLLQFINEQREK